MRRWGMAFIAATAITLTACFPAGNGADTEGAPPAMTKDPGVFLEQVKTVWAGPKPDDDVLLEHGSTACAQLHAGTPHPRVTIFASTEESPDVIANTRSVVDAAALSLCPAASQ